MSYHVCARNQTHASWFSEKIHVLLGRCITTVSPYPFFILFVSLTHMPLAHQSTLSASVLLRRISASSPHLHPIPSWRVMNGLVHIQIVLGIHQGPGLYIQFSAGFSNYCVSK